MKRVLLIDDDPVTNFINKRIIEKTGLANEILVAQSGRQGLDIIIENNNKGESFPDLIILDINMPLINGFEFLHHLNNLNIPERVNKKIAILTSSDNMKNKTKASQLGIDTYLVKPATSDALISLLR